MSSTHSNSSTTGGIVSAAMMPHPPIILPAIGRGEEKKIADIDEAMRTAAKTIAASQPETVVIITPHAPSWSDYIQISSGPRARDDLSQYGDVQDDFRVTYDQSLAKAINDLAEANDVPTGTLGQPNARLDQGFMVPLYYLQQELPEDVQYLRVGIGGVDNLDHYAAGMMIQKAAEQSGKRVAVVGSGDLSHCQKAGTHYGWKACGPAYDAKVMDLMKDGRFDELLKISDKEADEAMVCGQKPFCVMAGALDQKQPVCKMLGHSAEFGVGYGICTYEQPVPDASRNFYQQAKDEEWRDYQERTAKEDPYVQLARAALEAHIAGAPLQKKSIELPQEMLEQQAGTFVSLHKNGALRGCIGTTSPTTANIAEEIQQNAVSASTRDPRFPAVDVRELPALEISVDVLGAPEPIDSPDQLDIKRYGVIVTKGRKRGLLLPDLEGVDTIAKQVAIAKQKAGLDPEEEGCSLERFEVIRHH